MTFYSNQRVDCKNHALLQVKQRVVGQMTTVPRLDSSIQCVFVFDCLSSISIFIIEERKATKRAAGQEGATII
jgi:hypothetical protein